MKRNYFKELAAVGVVLTAISAPAHAVLKLPDVEPCVQAIQDQLSGGLNNLQCLAGTSGMTYVASIHDEFLSFSIEALEKIQKENESLLPIADYGDWSKLVSGSGQLDVGIMIKAHGSGVLNNYDPFPDAADSNTSDPTYERDWGGDLSFGVDTNDPGDDPNDPVLTVQDVVDWLAGELPAFYFDLADPQNAQADLYVSGEFYVTDSNHNVLDTWAFDNMFNGEYDANSMVLAPKNVPVYIQGSGCTDFGLTDVCKITNSRGSGSPEFIAYAAGMVDLINYANGQGADANLFFGHIKISSTSAADEELYLTKRVAYNVPNPGVIALLGSGLLGFAATRRRKQF